VSFNAYYPLGPDWLPIVVAFAFLQKRFVAGVTAGAVK